MLLYNCISFCQENPREFDSLFDAGVKLYRQDKDYKNAALTFSAAFHVKNAHPSNDQRYTSAFVWVLAKYPDSAFSQLAIIAESKEVTFDDASNILNDSDFESIYDDPKWQLFKNKMFSTLRKKYIPADIFKKNNKRKLKISIDESHYNGHTIAGTYSVLSGLLDHCGFEVSSMKEKFSITSLANTNLLIISNPYPNRWDSLVRWAKAAGATNENIRWAPIVAQPGYTDDEAKTIKSWVENGGSLLLILDHAPNPKAGSPISNIFDIDWPNISTYDTLSWDPKVDTARGARTILFTRSNGSFGKHPIIAGIDSVTTYTGSSFIGPPNSIPLLYLSPTAYDQDWDLSTKKLRWRSAAGRIQALALEFGRGKIVMLGEAAMISPTATSRSNRGNWQMTLNILRWLTGDLK